MTAPDDRPALQGLSEDEAARRAVEEGPNTLPDEGRRSTLAIVGEVVREPMFLLLVSCGTLYLVLGDPTEAAMLLGFVVLVVAITVVQERRTERALDALRDRSSPRASVIRGGQRRRIPSADLVRGDLVVVSEGDRVPADGFMVAGRGVSADESLVTGEAAPVRKQVRGAEDAALGPAGGDDTPWLFSGTLVVSGQAVVEVAAIGAATAMGRIGTALAGVETGRSRLQEETRRIVRVVATAGSALCVGLVVFYGLTRGAWLEGLLTGLSTAMALLPEEFPVVLTVFLALGAWRISRQNVLTRRMAAIETLGSTTVLCTDKTGTLTQNQMVVRALWTPHGTVDLDGRVSSLAEPFHALVEHAILASQVDPFDPMEQAFRSLGLDALSGTEHLHPDWSPGREYPLSSDLLAMTRTWEEPGGERVGTVSAKGAPEAIFDLCHLPASEVATLTHEVEALAARGLRVLAVASARHSGALPDHQHGFAFVLEGLIGLEDPIRPAVPGAVAQCREAGIRVLMITGDYAVTAQSIARQAGIPAAEPLTGPELEALDDAALASRLGDVTVAARIVPEDKLRLVQALQARGDVVAMTGDGVNDAPALKAAHIGVAMGGRGTDVAREAAALVLLDDDFSSIVDAVALGRRIFDNLRKAMVYVVSIHVPLAGLATVPVLAGWPVALLPVHIVFLELVIDPACSLVFEAEPADPDAMRRPPRAADDRMLDGRVLALAVAQGLGLLVACIGVYAWGLSRADDPMLARSVAFATLMIGNVGLITSNRSWELGALQLLVRPNRAYRAVVLGALAVLGVVLYAPGLNGALHFQALGPVEAVVAGLSGLAAFGWAELAKLSGRPSRHPLSSPA
ncbi:MAG: cation-translocating P-type ATPase [Myxococcota bacterium]